MRSAYNVVALDLDGDGYEQTGWVVIYLHLADQGRIPTGTRVELDDQLGHPSCERGDNTGTHVHIARKYNGEWLAADGAIPFVLSGWETHAGERNYKGHLTNGEQIITAHASAPRTSHIQR